MSPAAVSPPVVSGRFALDPEARRGGMATVWRARDQQTGAAVAIKVLGDSDDEQAQRFLRESALLASLDHPAIVRYVAHGLTADGVPYLAMEWLEGETLAERLARGPLSVGDSLTLVESIGRGLGLAHQRGIVHRDVKPSNLFLRGGALDDVVLLDLGIAREVEAGQTLTRVGSVIGTPAYMPPEQAQGLPGVGPTADVFSLGCLLFECLTGRPPFTGAQMMIILAKILFEPPPRLRELQPAASPALEQLVERMLSKTPAERPADAAAVVAAVKAIRAQPAAEPTSLAPAPVRAEQQLVSVILAAPAAGAPPSPAAELPDVSLYGAEVRRLIDGTTIVTVAQRRAAAGDLAVRAVRCAMRLREIHPDWYFALATGRGIQQRHSHIGEVVERAAALAAPPAPAAGTVLLDEATAGLLGARFDTRGEGEGRFVLVGEALTLDPSRPLLGRPTTCVGREHELGTLELTLRTCIEESAPRAVLVVGPPGMGKSRLRHELVRRRQSRADEVEVLLGLGDPIRAAASSGLLGGALLRLCGVAAGTVEPRAAFAARIGRHLGADKLRITAFLGELCGLPFPPDTVPELRAAHQDPRIMASQIERAWLDFVRAETAARPLLLVLDDLQWSDALTLGLVEAALRELETSPFLVLALARPEIHELHPALWTGRATVMPLRPLPAPAAARLVREVLGAAVSDDSVQRIVSRAAGNALFVEELMRAAEARRDAVPDTVLAMLQARIGLLPAAARRALRAASVFGESFPLDGVEALLRDPAPEEPLADTLVTLTRHEILEQRPDEAAARRWRFRHVLMRDAAYSLLTNEDCRVSHAQAARYLVDVGEDDAVVAAHFERGGDQARAVHHYLLATEHAYRANDLGATLALVARGLAAGAQGEARGVLQSIAAPTLFYRWDFPNCWAAASESLALLPPGHSKRAQSLAWRACVAMQLGRSDEVVGEVGELVALDPGERDRADYATALGYAVIAHSAAGNRREAERLVNRLAEIGNAAGNSSPFVGAVSQYGRSRFVQLLGDDPVAAWQLVAEATRAYEGSGQYQYALVASDVGEAERRLFSVAQGERSMRRLVEYTRRHHEPVRTAYALQFLATLLAEHGPDSSLPEARTLAVDVQQMSGAGSAYHAFGQIALSLVCLREDDLAAAEAEARGARATLRGMGLRAYWPHADTALLRVLARKRDPEAGAIADEALRNVEELAPMGLIELPLRLAAAHAQLAAGRQADAIQGLERALQAMDRRLAHLIEPPLRQQFLAIPEHAALRALASELGLPIGWASTIQAAARPPAGTPK